jgi:hypothetical protein
MTGGQRPLREVTLERACSRLSADCGEALRGTASTVTDWLLIEQPGAWGREALANSDLPPEVAQAVRTRAAALGVRPLLIRRPGRAKRLPDRTVYAVHTGPDSPWQRRVSLESSRDLLDIDLADLFRAEDGRSSQPLYAVCTNGKHDVCCAVAGIPLARRIARLGDVWECSHVGGDRFAANLVCFPDGLYYGRVLPETGLRILERHARRELLLSHYRGRSCYPFAVQAAEQFVRQSRALHRIDDVVAVDFDVTDGVDCSLTLRSGETLRVVVDVTYPPPARRLTCQGEPVTPPSYRVRWDSR